MLSKEKILNFILLFSLIGIVDTAYLSYTKATASALYCGVLEGCNKVAASQYSEIFGIPLAYIGLGFYLFLFGFGLYLLYKRAYELTWIGFSASFLAVLASLYFVYLQVFKIQAYCIYCLISAFNSVVLFILFFLLSSKIKVLHENTNKDTQK